MIGTMFSFIVLSMPQFVLLFTAWFSSLIRVDSSLFFGSDDVSSSLIA